MCGPIFFCRAGQPNKSLVWMEGDYTAWGETIRGCVSPSETMRGCVWGERH